MDLLLLFDEPKKPLSEPTFEEKDPPQVNEATPLDLPEEDTRTRSKFCLITKSHGRHIMSIGSDCQGAPHVGPIKVNWIRR